MGGTPTLALNVVGWPVDVLPLETARRRPARRPGDRPGRGRARDRRPHDHHREGAALRDGRGRRSRTSTALLRNTEARPGMGARAHEADRRRHDHDRGEARRRHRRPGRRTAVATMTHAERGGVASGGRRRCPCRHRCHGLRAARPPPQAARGERLRRRRSTPRRCRCWPACSSLRSATSLPAAPSGTTRGSGRRRAGARPRFPSSSARGRPDERRAAARDRRSGGCSMRCAPAGRRLAHRRGGRSGDAGRDPGRGPPTDSAVDPQPVRAQGPTVFGNNDPAGSICTCNRRARACTGDLSGSEVWLSWTVSSTRRSWSTGSASSRTSAAA